MTEPDAGAGAVLPRTLVVGASTLASRVLGLVREVVTAGLFGTSGGLDMFLLAFTVPNLFRRLFGEGAVGPAFIPEFTRRLSAGGEEARRLLRAAFGALAALLGAITVLGWLACAAVLLFARASEEWRLFCVLLAVMLPYLPLICLAALEGAALNVKGHFLAPALAPAVLNLCWIAAAALYGERLGVTALAGGVLVAGLLQYAGQVPLMWRHGLSVRPLWDLAQPGLRRVAGQMLPVVLGGAAFQVNVLLDRLIALLCVPGAGAVSALHYGNRLMQFPLGVMGLALATASFPLYARQAARGDRQGLARSVNLGLRTALFLSLPCMAVMAVLNVPVVRVLFERGRFDAASTARTADVLLAYAAGLWAFCAVHLLARAFYAMQDTRTPVRIALYMVGANLLLNLVLVWPLREAGLALASSLTAAGNAALLFRLLGRRVGRLGLGSMLRCAAKSAAAAAVAGVAGLYVWGLIPDDGALRAGLALGAGLCAVGVVYLACAWLLRSRTLAELMRFRKSALGPDER